MLCGRGCYHGGWHHRHRRRIGRPRAGGCLPSTYPLGQRPPHLAPATILAGPHFVRIHRLFLGEWSERLAWKRLLGGMSSKMEALVLERLKWEDWKTLRKELV